MLYIHNAQIFFQDMTNNVKFPFSDTTQMAYN